MATETEFRKIVKALMDKASTQGIRLTYQDLSESIGYDKSYISGLMKHPEKVRDFHVKILKKTFADQLAGKPFDVIKKPSDINNPEGILITKILKIDATQEIILESIAEVLARSLNVPVTSLLGDLKKAVENRITTKLEQAGSL